MPIRTLILTVGIALATVAHAGPDQPWNDLESGSSGDIAQGLVLLAAIAFVIHLVEKGEFGGFLRDLAKGLSFLAAMYLMVFWFIACIAAVAFLLRSIGLEKSTSGFIAFPAGLYLAYKIYCAYESWRRRKPTE
jgi:Fe2+ transport system protein B